MLELRYQVSIFRTPQVVLPPQFIATKFPGYFWNDIEEHLYSLKSGVLKKIKPVKPSIHNSLDQLGYKVSVNGKRRWMMVDYLRGLKRQYTLFPVL